MLGHKEEADAGSTEGADAGSTEEATRPEM
jgi:hypothetical protein